MTTAARRTLQRWKADPVAFVRECLHHDEIDDWQLDVLRAFPHQQRMAVPAAKGCGKTAIEAWLIWNFIATRPHANVAATSISSDQLQDGLWKECAKWQLRSPFLLAAFEWQKTRIVARESPGTWWASARSWSKNADAQAQSLTMAGLHADYMFFVLDESGGMPMPIMATAEAALASGIECKLFQAGNTTTLGGPLHTAVTTHQHLWWHTHVTGDPDNLKRSPRISLEWAKQQIELFGRENPWVKVNVFGEFPPASLQSLFGEDEVRASMAKQIDENAYSWAQQRQGIDVARFGDDRSVLAWRQGLRAWPFVTMRGERTTTIASQALLQIRNMGRGQPVLTTVDDTGHWGHGVIDNMVAAGVNPVGIQFHGKAYDPRYRNHRAEMWLGMSEWVKRGGVLPNDSELIQELTTPQYTFHNGVFQLEDKDLVKERLGRSPDLADALALTFAVPEVPAAVETSPGSGLFLPGGRASGSTEPDWDPFAEREPAR